MWWWGFSASGRAFAQEAIADSVSACCRVGHGSGRHWALVGMTERSLKAKEVGRASFCLDACAEAESNIKAS
jgi:hypothetical protein